MSQPLTPLTPAFVLRQQVATLHFWFSLAAFMTHVVIAAGILTSGPWLQGITAVSVALQAIGYQAGALWQPPRSAWTEEQKNEYFAAELRRAGYTVKRPLA